VAQTIRVEDAVNRYRGPVLILQGDEDDVVTAESVRNMAKRYTDCRMALIAGETHHFDRKPDEMQRIIREWMTAQK
jgi:pimeloyl-ACP methyl ester carboxylesterase